jgi:isoquinoline 1-oxidoreductase subunit alpha
VRNLALRGFCEKMTSSLTSRRPVTTVPSVSLRLNVNGVERTIDRAPDTPLLWVLRESVGTTGVKFGCGKALCGACTVHLDGKPVRSCVTPVSAAQGKAITTIEGLGGEHPVQQAWMEENVPQCGYCQSGQIMSAVALLNTHPDPSRDQVDDAMSGNICRCGTYPRIRKAIARASRQIQATAQAAPTEGEQP